MFSEEMFALTLRLVRKAPAIQTFHSSAVISAKKYQKKKKMLDFTDDMKDFNVTLHLQNKFKVNHRHNWDQLKKSILGLPANEYSLVNKNNVDAVLWDEIVKFGSVDLAMEYSRDGEISEDKARHGLIKILREVVISQQKQVFNLII